MQHIVFDLRGHARSEAPVEPTAYSLARVAQDVHEVLAHCRQDSAEPVILVGLSLGAMVALEALRQQREQYHSLVLVSPPNATHTESVASFASHFADAIDAKGLQAAGEQFVWGGDRPPREAELIRQGFFDHQADALRHLLRGAIAELPDLKESAAQIQAFGVDRVLLMVGDQDAPALAFAEELVAILSKLQVSKITDGGHLLNLTSGPEFCDALSRFITQRR